jgi:endonuclease/exonuclease/phosphatase (EEP) superfamily protein YafD
VLFSIFWPFKLAAGLFKALLNLLIFISCALTIAALMGDRGWLWSLSTHFHMQYLSIQLIALLAVSIAYWNKAKKGESVLSRLETWFNLVALMFFAGLNLSQIAPYYWPPLTISDSHSKNTVKVMHINLFGYLNHNRQLVETAIQSQDPDIVDLVEYTEPWQRDLEHAGIFKKYPYRKIGQGHIGLYSKLPLRNARLVYADPNHKVANQANIVAQFRLSQQPVTILVAHPASPIQPSHLEWQQTSFRKWGKERPTLGKNLLIVGDLNTAPWSVEFRRLLKETGLRDSQVGFGLQPSWPTFLPFVRQNRLKSALALPFGIPIDHILVSDNIQVLTRHTGPFIGSDHLPVIAELNLQNTR